jgi:hypothetical protein
LGILNAACHAGNPASSLHRIQPLLLLWPEPAGWCLDLYRGEYRYLGANHLWGDGHRAPAKQITRAFAPNAKLNPSTTARVRESANVVPEKPG